MQIRLAFLLAIREDYFCITRILPPLNHEAGKSAHFLRRRLLCLRTCSGHGAEGDANLECSRSFAKICSAASARRLRTADAPELWGWNGHNAKRAVLETPIIPNPPSPSPTCLCLPRSSEFVPGIFWLGPKHSSLAAEYAAETTSPPGSVRVRVLVRSTSHRVLPFKYIPAVLPSSELSISKGTSRIIAFHIPLSPRSLSPSSSPFPAQNSLFPSDLGIKSFSALSELRH